jgi:prepilin-type N-terminal cleavage/methylation domain-containing protein
MTLPFSNARRCRRFRSSGFTLIELLVVIAIIAVLLSLLLPAVQQAREAARRTQCKNNLMQLGVALNNYMMAHGVLPPGTQNDKGPIVSKEDGGYHMSWMAQILPYIEQQNAYDMIDFTQSVYAKVNLPVRQHFISIFRCPTDPSPSQSGVGMTSYCGIHNDFEAPIDVDQNGVLFLNSSIDYDQIRDGSSNTLYVVEAALSTGADLGWMSGTRSSLRNLVVLKPGASATTSPTSAPSTPPKSEDFYSLHNTAMSNGYLNFTQLGKEVGTEGNREFVGGASSYHTGGFHGLMGDGAVRFISNSVRPLTLRNLANRRDGELLEQY